MRSHVRPARRRRAVELREGFLGPLLLAQQRAEIVPCGGVARRDLECLAIRSLRLGVPALAAQRDAECAPGFGIAGVGGQQLLRFASRGRMQRGVAQQPGEPQACGTQLGRDLQRHPVGQLRIGNSAAAAQQVAEVGVVFGAIRRGFDARAQQGFRLVEVPACLRTRPSSCSASASRGAAASRARQRFGRWQLTAAHQVMGSRQLEIPVHARKSSMRRPPRRRIKGKKNGGLAPAVQCSRERLRFCQNL